MDVENQKEKPRVMIKSLSFNDGSSFSLNDNSIIVFTGTNNCGKSQVLREIEWKTNSMNAMKSIVLSDCEIDFFGSIANKKFLDSSFLIDGQGRYIISSYGIAMSLNNIKDQWDRHELGNGLGSVFVL